MYEEKYYYNTVTQQVERGHQGPIANLMGPYDSPEEAARAYEIAAARTEKWDQEDEEWENWGAGSGQ